MKTEQELNLGEQPISGIMAAQGLRRHDLVAKATDPITFKMVARACKGRRLTPNVKLKILSALNAASGGQYTLKDLFNY